MGQPIELVAADAPALLDIASASDRVKGAGRVAIVGYCWGGPLSWLAAGTLEGLSASVPYYGGGMPERRNVTPRCPVLAHFGENDAHIPLAGVAALQAAHPGVTVQLYPAGHGFNCDQRSAFDAPSATLARARTLAFLRQHIG